MNELMNNDIKMTSLDLAELTGKEHKHVMRDIRNEIEELGEEVNQSIFGLVSYIDKKGESRPCYQFGKKGAMQLALKYDAKTRYRVIERIEELENKSSLPQTFSEALRLAADLQEKIEQDKPKVESFERFISGENNQKMSHVAKALGIGRNKLFQFLREEKLLMKDNTPYQKFIDRGYFETKETPIQMGGQTINKVQTYVTAKGVSYIDKRLNKTS